MTLEGALPKVAIFVDAGYLFAQGSTALTGAKQPRSVVSLNVEAAVGALLRTTRAQGIEQKLLRVYWYDGARGSAVLPADHAAVARMQYVKLRLGMINGVGQQKGVDSLIVTDMIELARNRAIDDAVLLSGDDDVRVGVSIAQTFGVCVHLIGIEPSIGSQSPLLLQEADTTTEWDARTVGEFLSVKAGAPLSVRNPVAETQTADNIRVIPEVRRDLTTAIQDFVSAQAPDTLLQLKTFWSQGNRGIPPESDRPLLISCGKRIGRRLGPHEAQFMREKFAELVRMSAALP
jgi:uncharacterized LabA/DUF88 family protein